MINQNRYKYLLFVIALLGLSTYIFIIPNFEKTVFNTKTIENISKGITTTSIKNETEVEESDVISNEIAIIPKNENPLLQNEYLKNSKHEVEITNFTTYLLIGSDERSNQSSASRGDADGSRADVIILGLIHNSTEKNYLISVPRDILVVNNCTNNIERINASFNENACGNKSENLAAAVKNLTGITVNHFASFNFEGFEKIIDSFNGIEICVDVTQKEGFSFEIQKGCQQVQGSTALNWVVSRKTEVLVGEKILDINGNDVSEWKLMEGVSDLSRNQRQQYIILQLIKEIKNFKNLSELTQFVSALEDTFVIDENLSLNKAVELLWKFRNFDLNKIQQPVLPVKNFELSDGRQVLVMTENFSKFAQSVGLLDS